MAAIALVVLGAACADDDAATGRSISTVTTADPTSTTTQVPPTTTQAPIATTTTTDSSEAHLETGRAIIEALFDPNGEALDAFSWANDAAKQDAADYRETRLALNIEILDTSCEIATNAQINCSIRARDDLTVTLGVGSSEDTVRITFGSLGPIAFFEHETNDEVVEAFLDWVFENNPNLCDSPAQCASALLGLVAEYLETVLP